MATSVVASDGSRVRFPALRARGDRRAPAGKNVYRVKGGDPLSSSSSEEEEASESSEEEASESSEEPEEEKPEAVVEAAPAYLGRRGERSRRYDGDRHWDNGALRPSDAAGATRS